MTQWDAGGLTQSTAGRQWKQRCFLGDCGRSIVVGRERGVCAVLMTALQAHRARQQERRVLLLDLMDDEEEPVADIDEATEDAESHEVTMSDS